MAAADLTAQRLRELLDYDQETGLFTRRVPVARQLAGASAGCRNKSGYLVIRIDNRLYYAHRLAWLYMTGEWPAQHIDHVDGKTDNNRFANLRDVSRDVNLQNRHGAQANTLSGLLGAGWDSQSGKWRAEITTNGRKRFVGSYTSAEEAHEAYLDAKRKLHDGCTI